MSAAFETARAPEKDRPDQAVEAAESTAAPAHAKAKQSAGDVQAFFVDGGRTRAKKANNPKSGDELTFTDIDATGKASIKKAMAHAKTKVASAITQIAGAKTAKQAKAARYFKIDGTGSDEKKAVDKVLEVFGKIQTALNGKLEFEGEKPDGNTQAYVYTGFVGLFDGAIHIHFPNFNNYDLDEQAAIIIHELSHKYAGTDDNAYLYETGKWNKMSMKDACNNADSYCYYAVNAS